MHTQYHIDQVCRSCYYQLRQLKVIARSLTSNADVSLVHALCSAALIIKFDHISHYMRDVSHRLPFPQRISYRIAPSYLRELCRLLSSCAGRRSLRSTAHGNLVVPFARSAAMQTRSFSVVGILKGRYINFDLLID